MKEVYPVPAEVESALVAHEAVAEAAVVGMPHEIKGQGICSFVTLQAGTAQTEELRAELIQWVRKVLGPVATPDALITRLPSASPSNSLPSASTKAG
jgi:acyl-coenzyme A synthetase/AMP-(fatty) acid ligase